VLDRLLPIAPDGVREVRAGRHVELRMRGASIPAVDQLRSAAGRWPHKLSERRLPDDWHERRLLDYEPDRIGRRLVVRPEWAPAAGAAIEIVLGESGAFGAGKHPTTRTCLELLLNVPVLGSFADLGCGSGVLAILAARLGWSPVVAIDVNPESVEAARENARRNGVSLEARIGDLGAVPPPMSDGFAANVPGELHAQIAAGFEQPPRVGLVSGIEIDSASDVSAGYAARGMREQQRIERHGWSILVLKRD
jgi:ribosomal protein L11 methyltransferase